MKSFLFVKKHRHWDIFYAGQSHLSGAEIQCDTAQTFQTRYHPTCSRIFNLFSFPLSKLERWLYNVSSFQFLQGIQSHWFLLILLSPYSDNKTPFIVENPFHEIYETDFSVLLPLQEREKMYIRHLGSRKREKASVVGNSIFRTSPK